MIEDADKDSMTVTNDIDFVVGQIAKKENVNPVEHTIIYKDSEGNWDGYIYSTRQFFPLREKHWLKAAIKYVNEL